MYSTYKQLSYAYQFAGIKRGSDDLQTGKRKEWRNSVAKPPSRLLTQHYQQLESSLYTTAATSASNMTEKLSVGHGIGRRRTLNRIAAGSLIGHSRKLTHETSRHASDATSDMLNKSNTSNANVKLENTYQIGPMDNERFDSARVEKAMKDVLESRLSEMEYDREQCIHIAKELASEIQHRIKIFGWKRYKLVCHVTIGQNSRQGVHVVSRCVWDDKADNYSCVRYNNKSLFAVAQCYGVYFE